MKLVSIFIIGSALIGSVLSAPNFKRTVAQVEADIANISSQVTSLDTAINAFPGSGLAGALVRCSLCLHFCWLKHT